MFHMYRCVSDTPVRLSLCDLHFKYTPESSDLFHFDFLFKLIHHFQPVFLL